MEILCHTLQNQQMKPNWIDFVSRIHLCWNYVATYGAPKSCVASIFLFLTRLNERPSD